MGFDIGGTKCAVSILEDGKVREVLRVPTGEFAATFAALTDGLRLLLAGKAPLMGVSCGSPLDAAEGIILAPPNLAASWHGVPIVRLLTEKFGGRACLMNDANACALAEWKFGAGRGSRHMIFLTSGTGMGGGLILNGELYEGATGDAGEIGHVRLAEDGPVGYGKVGSVEGFTSGGGIARLAARYLEQTNGPAPAWHVAGQAIETKRIAEAALAGEPHACEILRQAGARLGETLAILIDLFNPERIVLGGFYPRCRELLEPAMRLSLERETLAIPRAACAILPAELGETIGSHGAVAAALHVLDRPLEISSTNPTLAALARNYPDLAPCLPDIEAALNLLTVAFAGRGKLLVCGNGGSAADADHIVGELVKGFMLPRPVPAALRARLQEGHGEAGRYLADHLQGGLPAIALAAHSALATAFANDVAADLVFAQQVHVYGQPGDVLLALSTSGRSANVLHALRVARTQGLRTIGLTGRSGGGMAPLCDVLVRAPFDETPRIQERHLPVYHALCIAVEAHFFGGGPGQPAT